MRSFVGMGCAYRCPMRMMPGADNVMPCAQAALCAWEVHVLSNDSRAPMQEFARSCANKTYPRYGQASQAACIGYGTLPEGRVCMPFCLEQARVRRRGHRQISVISTSSISSTICGGDTVLGDIEGLKRSIRRVGLLSPLLVRARGAGQYQLIAGARRLAACRALGMDEVECIVMPALDEECLLAALGENTCRAAPAPDAVRRIRHELSDRHGYTGGELDELSGSGWCGWEDMGDESGAQGCDAIGNESSAHGCDYMRDGSSARGDDYMGDAESAHGDDYISSESDAFSPFKCATADEALRGCAADTQCLSALNAYAQAPREQAYDAPGSTADAPCAASRRVSHGYVRDARLIVNAVSDVVDKLRSAGIDARMSASHAADGMSISISFPCTTEACGAQGALSDDGVPKSIGNHADTRADSLHENELSHTVKGEHSVEFCDLHGDNAHLLRLTYCNIGNIQADTALDISDIGRELARISDASPYCGCASGEDIANLSGTHFCDNANAHDKAAASSNDIASDNAVFSADTDAVCADIDRNIAPCTEDGVRISTPDKPAEFAVPRRHGRHSAQNADDIGLIYSPRKRMRGVQLCAGDAHTSADAPLADMQAGTARADNMPLAQHAPLAGMCASGELPECLAAQESSGGCPRDDADRTDEAVTADACGTAPRNARSAAEYLERMFSEERMRARNACVKA